MIYVFIGPTISRPEAEQVLSAEYLPPVSQGDVLRLVQKKPDAIAIIDGYFEWTPAVWHKEILFALEQGIPVYGASSMGALRASELHTFGMEGVGQIFEWYRDGVIEDDDEVALIHGPRESGFLALSEPMVNVRFTVERAFETGVLSEENARRVLAAMKRLPYPERSYDAVVAELNGEIGEQDLQAFSQWVSTNAVDLKKSDALALLQRLRDDAATKSFAKPHAFAMEKTRYWNELVDDVERRTNAEEIAANQAVLERIRQSPELLSRLAAGARQRVAATREEDAADDKNAVRRELKVLLASAGIEPNDLPAWMARNGLDEPALLRALAARATVNRRFESVVTDAELLLEAKLSGVYASLTPLEPSGA